MLTNDKWRARHAVASEWFDYVMLANMALWLVGIVLWVAQEVTWKKAHDVAN